MLTTTKYNIGVLVAPLDWGLGHATRCIPIIRLLLQKGCRVVIAAEGPHEQLLRQEFPQLTFVHLPGYGIRYSRKALMLGLLRQLGRIQKAIEAEHRWLQTAIKEWDIQWVISDNRYGLWNSGIPCTFITHQLQPQTPQWLSFARPWARNRLYKYINRFSECWVPDLSDEQRGLSGSLGHPVTKPKLLVNYIGWLSRFVPETAALPVIKYKCLIVLSGPEPQRSLLEAILLKHLQNEKDPIMLVRGLPHSQEQLQVPSNISVHNHLSSEAMQQAFEQSEYLVSRGGYSTLMDAFLLQKKCIFIPTPGQTEQEYLGRRLAEQQMALVYTQQNFDLAMALQAAEHFSFHYPLNSLNNLLEMTVSSFLQRHFE